MVGSVRPNPSAEEVQFLGSLLAKLDTQTRNAQNLEKVLFIEYLCWLIGFMILVSTLTGSASPAMTDFASVCEMLHLLVYGQPLKGFGRYRLRS